jgi:hypothetical protein
MRTWIVCFAAILLAGVAACGDKPAPSAPAAPKEDPQITAIKAAVSKTTPDEKAILDKCLALNPEVNGQAAAMPLGDIVNDSATNKSDYNIRILGWEAHVKSNKRWKILLHYQDYQKKFLVAEWEYNPETNKVYPFEVKNAPQFWTGVGANGNSNKAKGK